MDSGRRVRGRVASPDQRPDLVPTPPIKDVTMVEKPVFDDEFGFDAFLESVDEIRTGRYPPAPEEGEELADFQECETFEEKKDWIIGAAIIRNRRLVFERFRSVLNPRPQFEYFTKEETLMIVNGWDQEA